MLKIIRESERKYNVDIACICGLRAAVVADFIKSMMFSGARMKVVKNQTWVKCPQKMMIHFMPFLSEEMVRNSVRKLEAKGIINVAVLDEDKFDRTYWYAFTDYGEKLLYGERST